MIIAKDIASSLGISSPLVTRNPNAFQSNLVYSIDLLSSLGASLGTDAACVRSTTGIGLTTPLRHAKDYGVNEGRFENDGIMLEASTTNYCLQNEDLTNATSWAPYTLNATVTNDTSIEDPEGGTGAWKIEATTSGSSYLAQITAAASANSFGFFYRKGNVDTAGIVVQDGATPRLVTDLTPLDAWQYIAFPAGGTIDTIALLNHSTAGTATAGDYFYVYLPCLFDKAYLGCRPIKTAAAAVTRTDEEIDLPSGYAPEQKNDFALAFNLCVFAGTGSSQNIVTFRGGTGIRRVQVNSNGTLSFFYGGTVITSTTTIADNVDRRILITGDSTNHRLFINGAEEANGTIGTTSGTHTSIDFSPNDAGIFKPSMVRIYDKYFLTAADAAKEAANYG